MCGIFLAINSKNVELDSRFKNRGPDYTGCEIAELSPKLCLCFFASVLAMRGNVLCLQPLKSGSGNILCCNGNIWDGIGIQPGSNDTVVLLEALNVRCDDEKEIVKLFGQLKGPFSIVFYSQKLRKLFFMRDIFGRRSLLWNRSSGIESFSICSIATQGNGSFREIPSGLLFILDFSIEFSFSTTVIKFREIETALFEPVNAFFKSLGSVKISDTHKDYNLQLFSLNRDVDFPDQLEDCDPNILFGTLETKFKTEIQSFIGKLSDAVRKRTEYPPYCKNCERSDCTHSKVGILFSGGVDSLLLAAIAHLVMEDGEVIDLLNVAFAETPNDSFNVPDRKLGLQAVEVLRRLYPSRLWNFVMINVAKEELSEQRNTCVAPLLQPLQTVLDDSIGCAMWFGARGVGKLQFELEEEYVSPVKILLLGSGADELLAGYSRHRTRFAQEGSVGLINELEMELGRISNRNLGRDDRIVSDHGRESRLPFLDEEVVAFLNQLPIHVKSNLRLPRGVGEKLILRLGLWTLGFHELCFSAKRAIQFGSRIAKLENRAERADQICDRLSTQQ